MKRMKLLAGVAVASMLALGAVVPASQAATAKTLTICSFEGLKSWSILDADWSIQQIFPQAVYDTILHENADGTVVPWAASKFYYTGATKTLLTLEIRKGIKFTDGTVLTNKVVAANINRYINPANNAHDRASVDDISGAVAVAPNKVLLTLKQPNPGLTLFLAHQEGLLTSPKNFGSATEKSKPVGSGPYILDTNKSQPGASYVFKSNPTYWNKPARKFDNLVIKVLGDQTAITNALKTGAVDGCNVLDVGAAAKTLTDSGLKLTPFLANVDGWHFVARNDPKSPVSNVKVRQAMNYAIDRNVLLQAVQGGYGYTTMQEFPKGMDGYVASLENSYPYNPTKAKALLAEAGYPNGFTLQSAQPFFFYFMPYKPILDKMMKDVGITIDWVNAAPPALSAFAEIRSGKYPMFYQGLQRDPNWLYLNFSVMKDAVWNGDHYTDATLESLINKYRTASPAAGKKIMEQLNTYWVQNALSIPLYISQGQYAYNNTKIKPVALRPGSQPQVLDWAPAK